MSHSTYEEKFGRKYKIAKNGCWIWTGAVGNGGPHMRFRGATWRASRISYELFKGPIPDGALVLHTCDNERCVNPDHLYAGNQMQNVKDYVERGNTIKNTMLKLFPGPTMERSLRRRGYKLTT